MCTVNIYQSFVCTLMHSGIFNLLREHISSGIQVVYVLCIMYVAVISMYVRWTPVLSEVCGYELCTQQ